MHMHADVLSCAPDTGEAQHAKCLGKKHGKAFTMLSEPFLLL